MRNSDQKVILITGVSSGIGAVCAKHLSNLGYLVYGTCRNDCDNPDSYKILKMDVTDEDSIQSAVKYIVGKEKRIDVLINNAGMGIAGPVENCSSDQIRLQFDVNFMGTVSMCQAVIPVMKSQKGGTIINISSLGGLFGMPYQAFYCASKFAIEGLSETMHMELKRYNINTVLVEPGDIKTNFTGNRVIAHREKEDNPESAGFNNTMIVIEKDERNGADPKIVAKLIGQIIKTKNPKLRYTVASFEQKFVPVLKRILPYFLFEKIITSHYHVQ